MRSLTSVLFLLTAVCATANHAAAAVTTLNGTPDIFDVLVIGDFDDNTSQGWTAANTAFGINPSFSGGTYRSVVAGEPINVNSSTSDVQAILNLGSSTLPGVPNEVTIGSLPGQYDIVQFDFKIEFVQLQANFNDPSLRGDQFFLIGGPTDQAVYYVNNGTGTGIGANPDTAPELPSAVNVFNTYTVQRFPTDPGWNSTYSRVRIDPVNLARLTYELDNIVLGRSNDIQPFTAFTPLPGAAVGDVNQDGVVDQTDVDVAEDYLAGEGGVAADVRQDTLVNSGNDADVVLAALNLTDFDLTGDDTFDAADVSALEALLGLPGDFNGDGMVDGADYAVWRNNLGSPEDATILGGNGDNLGNVDEDDLELWKNNFGSSNLASLSASTATPEPTTFALAAMILAASQAAARRRT